MNDSIVISFGRRIRFSVANLCAFLLAVAPIFDPYIIANLGSFQLKVMEVPMLLIGMILLSFARIKKSNQQCEGVIFLFIICELLLTVISFSIESGNREFTNALKNLIIELVYVSCVTLMWCHFDDKLFVRIAKTIAIWATVFLVVQYIAVNVGFTNIFNGKIPFLQVGKYDYWARLIDPNTGDIRVHSIFQEPAYYGMFILPVYLNSIQEKQYKHSMLFAIGLILSSSLVAIGGAALVTGVAMLFPSDRQKVSNKFKVLFIVLIAIGAILVLYKISPSVQSTIDYALKRFTSISADLDGDTMGSNKIRLLGYLERFTDYPLLHKIFGVGSNQFSSYLGVTAYSSSVVSIILNYGIIGICIFIMLLAYVFIKLKPARIFLFIFLLCMITDYQWVNWYFFYLLTWVFAKGSPSYDK